MRLEGAGILLIEDDPGDARLIREMLADGAGAVIPLEWADGLEAGLRRISAGGIDLVLLDLGLPESTGLETLRLLRARAGPSAAVVVLSGLEDEGVATQAVQEGAQDYLVKGQVDGGLLRRSMRYALERNEAAVALRRANDLLEQRVTERTTALIAANEQLHAEIEERRQAVEELKLHLVERTRAEEQHRRLEEQLRQSQKLEAVGRLAGGVAHDFNNLLTAIVTASDFLLEQAPGTQAWRQDAADIREAAERAAALTRQLLAFSRKQLVQPKVLDLNEVVLTMDRMLRRLLGEDIELVALPAPELGHVRVDPGQMQQVIVNLAVNARDAMPGGGRITVETANVEVGPGASSPPVGLAPGRHVLLAVRDTGHGMSPEVLAHLFEPFFTTKKPGKGTGLGLSTVYGIVRQAGGEVRVRSEPGEGSAIEIYLPRVDEPADVAAAEASAPARGTETVLLVEDEPMVRGLAARALRAMGYAVREAADGNEAWSLAEGHARDFDLVVTDVVMPRVGGKELAERLRRERPELQILFMSGYTEDATELQAFLGAGCQFLQKPFAASTLTRCVREMLDRRTPGSPERDPVLDR